MPKHGSLVIFTLMVQSAVGSVWCLQAAFFWNSGLVDPLQLKFQILVALGLVLAGLAAAIAHLGKPGDSLQAVKNFKSSWLSREICSVNLFAGLLVVMAVLAQIRPGASNGWLLLVGSLAGGAVLYTMTQVYRLRTVPSWNHVGTPLTFVGSALLLGGLLCTLVLKILTLLQVVSHAAMKQDDFRIVALIAVLVGFILKILACKVEPSGTISAKPFKTRQPVLQGVGVALWVIDVFAVGNSVFQSFLLFSAAVCLISGEIVHRAQFYSSYQRVGL
jgi:anaerobic dimethyl sulfoxide reductase subunit C (anchor subunit)